MAELNKKYHKRVIFPEGEQTKFLNGIQLELDLSSGEISDILGVDSRTFRDWKREIYSISLDAANTLSEQSGISLPKDVEIKEPFWHTNRAGKLGWEAVIKKYGKFEGNPKYRKKKWQEWWRKEGQFKKHPFIATCLPFTVPKESPMLAEIFGIILGDGSITKNQITITLNRDDDEDFINYLAKLLEKVFDVKPSLGDHKGANVKNLVISRKKLVEFLVRKGLKVGNKVKQQVSVPSWIRKSDIFTKFCMRGLLDTDGCFYIDKHRCKDKIYLNCGINFTNRSLPLLIFFKKNLTKLGYHPTQKTKFSIFLRREKEIIRYFSEIGSSNPKHSNKFKRYLEYKSGGVV